MKRETDYSLAQWATNLPVEWSITRQGNIADVIFSNVDKHTYDEEINVLLCNYTDVYYNNRITSKIEFMEASAEEREINKFQLKKGDVLATKDSESPDDIAISALVAEELPGVLCGYHLALVRPFPHKISGRYLAWLHSSKTFRAQYEARAVGVTRFGLAQHIFKEIIVPLPSLLEQERIATYLDKSCADIDAAVQAKRSQIEILETTKESLIESTVTKGLQPNKNLQRIDIDWMSEIPAHWKACRIKRIALRVDYGISEKTEEEGRFPVLKMGHIQNGEIVFTNLDYVDEVSDDLILEQGDVLYNRTNSWDKVGKAAVFRGEKKDQVTFASYLVRVRVNHKANPYFLNYVVNNAGFLGYARKLAIPSVQQSNLNSTRYCSLFIPLPPIAEQEAIVEFLDSKLANIKEVIAIINQQIKTLIEYRKSLIHECVTGKRRVTEADLEQV